MTTLIPAPRPSHLAFVADQYPRILQCVEEAGRPRGLVLARAFTGRPTEVSLTPTPKADLLHVMAHGVPEEVAVEVVEELRSYDPDLTALVLVIEDAGWSVVAVAT